MVLPCATRILPPSVRRLVPKRVARLGTGCHRLSNLSSALRNGLRQPAATQLRPASCYGSAADYGFFFSTALSFTFLALAKSAGAMKPFLLWSMRMPSDL